MLFITENQTEYLKKMKQMEGRSKDVTEGTAFECVKANRGQIDI